MNDHDQFLILMVMCYTIGAEILLTLLYFWCRHLGNKFHQVVLMKWHDNTALQEKLKQAYSFLADLHEGQQVEIAAVKKWLDENYELAHKHMEAP